jgi:hypothetical protein
LIIDYSSKRPLLSFGWIQDGIGGFKVIERAESVDRHFPLW